MKLIILVCLIAFISSNYFFNHLLDFCLFDKTKSKHADQNYPLFPLLRWLVVHYKKKDSHQTKQKREFLSINVIWVFYLYFIYVCIKKSKKNWIYILAFDILFLLFNIYISKVVKELSNDKTWFFYFFVIH